MEIQERVKRKWGIQETEQDGRYKLELCTVALVSTAVSLLHVLQFKIKFLATTSAAIPINKDLVCTDKSLYLLWACNWIVMEMQVARAQTNTHTHKKKKREKKKPPPQYPIHVWLTK